ncbi:BnaCnng70320D [Brassica napus]|uniref:BnaCnng70320D protein n=1 Tax=Brassica napus TaxID=3708 RepID=A0A078JWX8_BRANA|nr:BnaCnng70320D [Brassica napus]
MREEIKELKQLIMGKMTVVKYKRFFYSLPIVGERTEQQLILLAKAGLKEEIRDDLETEEFATLEALFEDAEEVEEGLKETPPSSPGKRRCTSPDHRSSKRARKAEKKGDQEDEGYGYPGKGETGLKDDEEGDNWEWMQMDTDVDDDASDWTDDTLGSGQFRMDNYPDSSGTDSSTSDSD